MQNYDRSILSEKNPLTSPLICENILKILHFCQKIDYLSIEKIPANSFEILNF